MDLVLQGLIDNSERGWWVLTETESVGPEATPAPLKFGFEEDEPLQAVAEDPPTFRIVADPTESIAHELVSAATDSASPTRLEEAVRDAMQFLGFDANQIGGAGQTDVLAVAPLGTNRYAMVLDAKSTNSGRVGLSQVDVISISKHRNDHEADFAVVVGPGFAEGELRQRAIDQRVCLLTTAALAELVRLHGANPVTLRELREVFARSPDGDAVVADVREAALARRRRQALLVGLMELIERLNRSQPDEVLLTRETLHAALAATPGGEAVNRAEVGRALSMLEMLGAITSSGDGGYTSETSLKGALDLLAAFGSIPEQEQPEITDSQAPLQLGGAEAG